MRHHRDDLNERMVVCFWSCMDQEVFRILFHQLRMKIDSMFLVDAPGEVPAFSVSEFETEEEKIRRLRAQMLIHSYIYYELDDVIIDDHTWQHRANELARINRAVGFYDKEFEGWDGSTGYHLPKDGWVRNKAERIIRHHREVYLKGL